MIKTTLKLLALSTLALVLTSCGEDDGESTDLTTGLTTNQATKGTSKSTNSLMREKQIVIVMSDFSKDRCESKDFFVTMVKSDSLKDYKNVIIRSDKNNKTCADYGKNSESCGSSAGNSGKHSCILGADKVTSQADASNWYTLWSAGNWNTYGASSTNYYSDSNVEERRKEEEADEEADAYEEDVRLSYDKAADDAAYEQAAYDSYAYDQASYNAAADQAAYDQASYDSYTYDNPIEY